MKTQVAAIALAITLLTACSSRDGGLPAGAKLQYVSTSESVALFTIENISAVPIKIRGARDRGKTIDLYRGDYALFCEKNEDRNHYLDGFRDPPEYAEIQAGERMSLRVHTDLTQRY